MTCLRILSGLIALGGTLCLPGQIAPVHAQVPALGQGTEPQVRFREPVAPHQPTSGAAVRPLPDAPVGGGGLIIPGGRFTLTEVVIDGASAYGAGALDPTYANLIGQSIGIESVQAIATAIQDRYRQDGFFITRVRIPAQPLDGGVLRLSVIEGYIVSVETDGATQPGHGKAIDYLRQVTAERPLRFATLERALLLANDLPGLTVSVVLRETNDGTGGIVLLARIKEDTTRGFASVDNLGSVFTGRIRGSAGLSSQARTAHGEEIQLVVQGAGPFDPGRNLVGQATASRAIGNDGMRISGLVAYGVSDVDAFLSVFGVDSESILGIAEVSYPIVRQRNLTVEGSASFEALNTNTDVSTAFVTLKDRTRVVALRGLVTWADSRRGLTEVDLSIRSGLPYLGANRRGDPFTSRPGGGSFVGLRGEVSRVQGVTERIYVVGKAAGQITSSGVLAGEEFTVGGYDYGRGFNEAQVTGDRGVAASAEVQFRNTVGGIPALDAYQVFGFVDYGRVRNQFSRLPQTITSFGGGVRTVIAENTLGEVLVAKPFGGRGTVRDGSDGVGDLDPQILFRLTGTF